MLRCVIFDLDGTILDTLEDLKNSVNAALKQFGYPLRTIEEVRSFVGNGVYVLMKKALPDDVDDETFDRVFAGFKDHYAQHCADHTAPYPGIIELITRLKDRGYLLSVVSNKSDREVQRLCRHYFPDIFKTVVGQKENIRKKPYPDSVNAVLKTFGLEPEQALYIGDSEVDIQTAENAGMDCILVSWGFRDIDFLRQEGAKWIVNNTDELMEIIRQRSAYETDIND